MGKRVVIRCTPLVLEELVAAPEELHEDPDYVQAREAVAHALLANLTTAQREAVELRMAGYSYSEAAETLGISIRSVRARVERGMGLLHQLAAENPNDYFLP